MPETPATTGPHVGQYRPDGVLLGCSCGWEGADIEAHIQGRIGPRTCGCLTIDDLVVTCERHGDEALDNPTSAGGPVYRTACTGPSPARSVAEAASSGSGMTGADSPPGRHRDRLRVRAVMNACPRCRSTGVGHLAIPNIFHHNLMCLNCRHTWKAGGRSEGRARRNRRKARKARQKEGG